MPRLPIYRGRKEPIQIGWVLLDQDIYDLLKDKTIRISASYPSVIIDQAQHLIHRWLMGAEKGVYVDHINQDIFDARRENLRLCTNGENLQNRKVGSANKKGTHYKGVFATKTKGSWYVKVKHGTEVHRVGTFRDLEEAARAYDAKALEVFGEFARLNFPLTD